MDYEFPIFDRIHVKKEDVKCGCLPAWTFLFRTHMWTEKESNGEGWRVFCGTRMKDHCSMVSGLLEKSTVPSCQEQHALQNGFFPPTLLEYFQLSPYNCSFSYLWDRLRMNSEGKEKLHWPQWAARQRHTGIFCWFFTANLGTGISGKVSTLIHSPFKATFIWSHVTSQSLVRPGQGWGQQKDFTDSADVCTIPNHVDKQRAII